MNISIDTTFSSELNMTSRKWEGKELREIVHLGLVGNLNLGLPEWQPNMLTTAPYPIHTLVSVDKRFYRLKVQFF